MKQRLEDCDTLCKIPQWKYHQASRMSSDVLQLLKNIEEGWSRPFEDLESSMWTEKDTKKLETDLKNRSFQLSLMATKFAEDHSQCLSECRRKRWDEIKKRAR